MDTKKLTETLYGGAAQVIKRRWILSYSPAEKDPAAYKDMDHWTREERMSAHFRDFIPFHKSFAEKAYRPTREEVSWMSECAVNTGSLMPHLGLFVPTILGQGSDEQIMWWLPRALTFKIIGAYAQTELAHGSNVRGLRTVAEYDAATEEFVLNSPSLGATKW